MNPISKNPLKAVLLAPWSVVLVNIAFSLLFLGHSLLEGPKPSGTLAFPNPHKPWEFVFLFSLYGLPTAYITLLLFFLPVYSFARKLKIHENWTVLLAAIICSIPSIVLWGDGRRFWNLAAFLIPHGIAVSFTYIWILRKERKNEPNQAAHTTPASASR